VLQLSLLVYVVLNLVSLGLYGWDKGQAKRSGARVPERTLHSLALLGGFAGAWLGMRLFRHKTQKSVFSVVLLLAAALHAAVWGWWLWRSARG
jgi:uncharacterized membrane protein YsdA (DUF1294 family)